MQTLQALLPDGDSLSDYLPQPPYPAKTIRRWELSDACHARYTARERADVERLHAKYDDHPTINRIATRCEDLAREAGLLRYQLRGWEEGTISDYTYGDAPAQTRRRLESVEKVYNAVAYRLGCLLFGPFYRVRNGD